MNQSLTRILSLICLHLNERARTHFLNLLPEPLQPEVREWHRRRSELIAGELSPAENRVLSSFASAEFEGEREDDPAVETRGRKDVPAAGQGEEEDLEVESFFSRAEERMEGADEGAPLGIDGKEGSLLPVSLLSLVLVNAVPVEAARLLVELPLRFQGRSIDQIVSGSAAAASSGLEADEGDLFEALRSHMAGKERWGGG